MSGAIICFECVGQRMGVGFSKYGGAAGAGARIAFFVLDVVFLVLEVALVVALFVALRYALLFTLYYGFCLVLEV